MNIHQLRNATIIVEFGKNRVLVDPMLARKGSLPPLRFFGARGRNPLVDLPESAEAAMLTVTHCLITHCQKGHFDHLDRKGIRFLRERGIPAICTPHDAGFLSRRGLNVQPLPEDHAHGVQLFGGTVRTVHCTHGRGLVGRLMEHGVGYLLEIPGEPSLYLSGDTILTPTIEDFVTRHQPDVSVIPAGGARFDVGHEIIMGIDDVLAFTGLVRGTVIANHLEALSHCPVTRGALSAEARKAGLTSRLHIPADGETISPALQEVSMPDAVRAGSGGVRHYVKALPQGDTRGQG